MIRIHRKKQTKNLTLNKKWFIKKHTSARVKTTFPYTPRELQFDNQPIRAMTARHVT